MTDLMKRFLSDEEGATMVEYALMVALIAVVSGVSAGSAHTVDPVNRSRQETAMSLIISTSTLNATTAWDSAHHGIL